MRVNSLLSFRGISADLVRRLKAAQSLGAVIRTAELLKSLCYIDLSRSQLNDCEVKLQGLEHILDIETFQLSMNAKSADTLSIHLAVTPTKIMDSIRELPQLDSSPVLGKKVFDLPKFTLHSNCDCYKCCNISYQYLVFVTTYIRAQLYSSQNDIALAFDHFHGAFKIRQKLFKEEKYILFNKCDEIGMKQFSWQTRFYITDYIQLLIDFCYFLKTNITSREQDIFDIANLAINLCREYKLKGHPVYVSAKELAFDNDFQSILTSSSCLGMYNPMCESSFFIHCNAIISIAGFMVPQSHDIDVNDYDAVPIIQNVCVTPSIQKYVKKPLSVRRKRSPVALKITKINMIWSDDEDDDNLSSTEHLTKQFKSREKLVKRKILEEYLSDDTNSSTEDSEETETELKETKLKNSQIIMPKRTKSRSRQTISEEIKSVIRPIVEPKEIKLKNHQTENNMQKKSIKDIIIKVAPLVPDISQNLMDLLNKSDVSNILATMENVDKLIEEVKNLKISSNTAIKGKRINDKKRSTIADYNKNINQAIKLLKDMALNEDIKKQTDSSTITKVDNLHLQDQKILDICSEKKSDKVTEIFKQNVENVNISSISEFKTSKTRHTKQLVNNEVHNTRTRSSLRSKKKPL